MSQAKAEEFVKKTFTDDEFAIEVIKTGEFKPGGKEDRDPADEGMENFVKAGKALGYDFTDKEAKEAFEGYLKPLGAWGMIKKLAHLGRLNKKVAKQMKW
jgi:hypothetical protein